MPRAFGKASPGLAMWPSVGLWLGSVLAAWPLLAAIICHRFIFRDRSLPGELGPANWARRTGPADRDLPLMCLPWPKRGGESTFRLFQRLVAAVMEKGFGPVIQEHFIRV